MPDELDQIRRATEVRRQGKLIWKPGMTVRELLENMDIEPEKLLDSEVGGPQRTNLGEGFKIRITGALNLHQGGGDINTTELNIEIEDWRHV